MDAELYREIERMKMELKQLRQTEIPYPREFLAPASITLSVGTSAQTVTAIQALDDGSVYDLLEANATPAQTLDIYWAGVTTFSKLVARYFYAGSASHYVRLQIYNYTNAAMMNLWSSAASHDAQTMRLFELPNTSDFISGGVVNVRFIHPNAGVPTHHLYIDWVALIK